MFIFPLYVEILRKTVFLCVSLKRLNKLACEKCLEASHGLIDAGRGGAGDGIKITMEGLPWQSSG